MFNSHWANAPVWEPRRLAVRVAGGGVARLCDISIYLLFWILFELRWKSKGVLRQTCLNPASFLSSQTRRRRFILLYQRALWELERGEVSQRVHTQRPKHISQMLHLPSLLMWHSCQSFFFKNTIVLPLTTEKFYRNQVYIADKHPLCSDPHNCLVWPFFFYHQFTFTRAHCHLLALCVTSGVFLFFSSPFFPLSNSFRTVCDLATTLEQHTLWAHDWCVCKIWHHSKQDPGENCTRSSDAEQEFHPCGAEKAELFVLANCPSNKHNYHQNSRSVPRLLKASGPTQISFSDKSPLIS